MSAVPTCKSCAHRHFDRCKATGYYTDTERKFTGPCGTMGLLWTPQPPRQLGIFERAWRYLFGGEAQP